MTLSPDGNWMWDGTEWIPAPPSIAPPPSPQATHVVAPPQVTHYPPPPPPFMSRAPVQYNAQKKGLLAVVIIIGITIIFSGVGYVYLWSNNLAEPAYDDTVYRWTLIDLTIKFEVASITLSEGDDGAWVVWELFYDIDQTDDDDRDGLSCFAYQEWNDSMSNGTYVPYYFTADIDSTLNSSSDAHTTREGDGYNWCKIWLPSTDDLRATINFCAHHNWTGIGEHQEFGDIYDFAHSWGNGCGRVNNFLLLQEESEWYAIDDHERNICDPGDLYGRELQSEKTEMEFDGMTTHDSRDGKYSGKATIVYDIFASFRCIQYASLMS